MNSVDPQETVATKIINVILLPVNPVVSAPAFAVNDTDDSFLWTPALYWQKNTEFPLVFSVSLKLTSDTPLSKENIPISVIDVNTGLTVYQERMHVVESTQREVGGYFSYTFSLVPQFWKALSGKRGFYLQTKF